MLGNGGNRNVCEGGEPGGRRWAEKEQLLSACTSPRPAAPLRSTHKDVVRVDPIAAQDVHRLLDLPLGLQVALQNRGTGAEGVRLKRSLVRSCTLQLQADRAPPTTPSLPQHPSLISAAIRIFRCTLPCHHTCIM